MANYYIDLNLTTGNNDGSTFDDAFQDLYTAIEYNSYSPGDNLVMRRRSLWQSATKDLQFHASSNGTLKSWIRLIGWPRNYEDETANFTQGSTIVDNLSWTATKLGYVGRKIYAYSDQWYLITYVNEGANTITLDRPYVGPTVTNKPCRVIQDEFYTNAQAIDDSSWTIKKTNWDSDTWRPPVINFSGTGYSFVINNEYIELNNLILGNSGDATLKINDCKYYAMKNCYVEQTRNTSAIIHESNQNKILLDRTVIAGDSGTSSQLGISGYGGNWDIVDSAIYAIGGDALPILGNGAVMNFDNVNIGVEVANGGDDIEIGNQNLLWKDVKLGGTVARSGNGRIAIENYNKEYRNSREYYANGQVESLEVSQYTGTPKRRPGGASRILKVTGNVNDNSRSLGLRGTGFMVAEHRFWADTTSRDYRLYVQADSMSTASNELFITVEHLSELNSSDDFLNTQQQSAQSISQRADDEDWSQYLEISGVTPDDEGFVTIRLYIGFYDADGILYIDPKMV